MAKSKTKQEEVEPEPEGVKAATFDFFSGEITDDENGVRVFEASSMVDPKPNKSGSYTLDYDFVIPFPEGRIVEIFGGEGTGKTTLALEVIGQALLSDPTKIALFVNMEKSLNVSLMMTIRSLRQFIDDAVQKKKGCRLWIVNATTGEQALEAIKQFCMMVPHGIAVLDSIDASQPETVLAGVIGENRVGNHGKLMSDAMRKLVGVAEANSVCVILINQLREKITMYGDPAETPGGKAVRFYATQRLRLKPPTKADLITMADGQVIGKIINYKIIKNKFAPEGTEGAFPILFKNGIFREQELVTQCCNFGILKLGGKGGKQVYLPKLDRNSGDFAKKDSEIDGTWMSQFNASRKLLIDPALTAKLDKELSVVLEAGQQNASSFVDEIQDAE